MNSIVKEISLSTKKHKITGIGDFSHGDIDIWFLRLIVIQHLISTTTKKIIIFQEDHPESVKHIYNDRKPIINEGEENFGMNYALIRYGYRIYSSNIYLMFIKYLRKHKDRIQMYGIDLDTKDRDYDMFNEIIKIYEKEVDSPIYLYFAHNNHVADRVTKNFISTGHYLKEYFGKEYKIILSLGINGRITFESLHGEIQKKRFSRDNPIKLSAYNKKFRYIENYTGIIYEIGWDYHIPFDKFYEKNIGLIIINNPIELIC